MNFGGLEEKEAFLARLQHVRRLLFPGGGALVDNVGLLGVMMDAVEPMSSPRDQRPSSSTVVAAGVAMQSFMRNSASTAQPEVQLFYKAEHY